MELQNARGTRDFLPKEKLVRNEVQNTLVRVFELYGFSPFETPVLERYDILSSKYAGGAEILKESFRLKDQGGRELGLRYDLTVPLSRFVGMNPQLKMPAKLYQIGNVFRDGPISASRYRQFMQCDVDIIGAKGMLAETELLSLANEAFQRLGIAVAIKLNSRKLLNELLDWSDIRKEQHETVILSIDKIEKFGLKEVEKELHDKGIARDKIQKVMEFVSISGFSDERIEKIGQLLKKSPGLKEIEELMKYLSLLGIEVAFDQSLARGLAYYTGTVFEITARDSPVKSAICAGGRYDEMISSLLGRGEYPAVGISFGLDRIYDVVCETKKPHRKVVSKVYIIPIKTADVCLKILELLRKEGIHADMDLSDRGPSKNLDYANSLNIPYVLIIGKKELEKEKMTLRDMKTGQEEMLRIDEVVKKLK
ncbi:MAG TPA: histidine--tRNA ligase [Candidatus Nanoarchaeia archaeon]|nr:histidine--tRNA ligase [Candidatus Nanoarchaeia archaeon]